MKNDIFGIDFFPTPEEVIKDMIQYSDIADKVVLEPSAGKGNIVDYLLQTGAREVIACEIDVNLRKILNTKCEVIADDFMTLKREDISHINMIIMNPPFSKQVEHILHAWSIAPAGCEIITLCNDSMIKKYSYDKKEQEIIELIENFGSSWSMGNCFKEAERRTDVWIGCIRIFKDGDPGMEFDGYFDMDNEDIIDQHEEGIQSYSYIRDVVSRYVEIMKNFDVVIEVEKHMNDMMSFFPFNISFSPTIGSFDKHGNVTKLSFQKQLQASAWKMIFNQCNIDRFVTSGVKEDLNKFIQQQQNIPFTVRNVYRMIQMIIGTHSQRMDQVIVEAFESICKYSDLNSSAGDKWKTNTNFLLNKKFIIPYVCDYDKRWPNEFTSVSYNGASRLDDLIKGLCFLTGIKYETVTDISHVLRCYIPWGQPFDWAFFTCKGHKSGTMHFVFQNEDLLYKFNRRYAEIKGWNLSNEKPKRSNSKKKAEEQSKQGTEVYHPDPIIINNEYQLF